MNSPSPTIKLAIMAPTPLAQRGITYFIHGLIPNAQCVATVPSLDKLMTNWIPGNIDHLVVLLTGFPEEVTRDTQQLLLLAKFDPALRILVYTYCSDASLLASLNAKPQISLLARQESYEQTRQNMGLALSGTKVCSQGINACLREILPLWHEHSAAALTLAERRVLNYLLQGMNLSTIASLLHRSIKTISAHKCNSMRKLGARNDSELFRHLQCLVAENPQGARHPSLQERIS
ncbi:TPA: LuxR C-terminal-related transcriptional regulator [Serratia fonticola]